MRTPKQKKKKSGFYVLKCHPKGARDTNRQFFFFFFLKLCFLFFDKIHTERTNVGGDFFFFFFAFCSTVFFLSMIF